MPTGQISEVIQQLRSTMLLSERAGLTDAQLLGSYVSRRDADSLAVLVRRHSAMVWGVCCRVLRNHHDAEDAFQATFLVLVRRAASIATRELLANWLYGVAHQTALKARATAEKRRAREMQVPEMPDLETARPEMSNDLQQWLDDELSHLPDKYRVPIVLCDLQGLTRTEAAKQLGCPEGTVAGRLARARGMLAKRLRRHGLVLTGATLAAMFVHNAAAAGAPSQVVSSTIQAASLFAAGSTATAGVVSANAVALTEGVLKAMLISKLKMTVTMLLLAALGLGAGALTVRGLAQQPDGGDRAAQRASRTTTEGLTAIAAPVVAVSADGKTITLEVPAQERGEEPKRTDVRITDKTEVSYDGVGVNGAKPTVGYRAHAWLDKGSADTAAKVAFSVVDATRQGRSFISGKVVGVADKTITLEIPAARDQEARKIDYKLTENTKLAYAYAKDAKPTVGYQADLWLDEGSTDTAAKVHFVDLVREQEALIAGKVVRVANDRVTVEVPARVRGEEAKQTDVKLTVSTEITFQRIGPNEANVSEGCFVRVWLQDGSPDTAVKAVFFGKRATNDRGR